MLKAITTIYNGNRYRSRLEARWAVFFDHMGWKYDYEPEGFVLPGGCYLPDFYFIDFDCYGEVKPKLLNDSEMLLCQELSSSMGSEVGAIDVVLFEGKPMAKSYRTIIDGESGINVIFTSSEEKINPFFLSDEFIKEWTMLDKTKEAIAKSNQYRFEHGEGLK